MCGFAILAAALSGCGPGEKPTGTVSGTVSYKGSKLSAGNVNLISKSGSAAMAKIDDTGNFKVEGAIAAGEYTAYASPPIPEPQAPGSKAGPPKKFDLPVKFRDPSTSGTLVTVNAGSNELPIEFKE
jgi:hypothetical protein